MASESIAISGTAWTEISASSAFTVQSKLQSADVLIKSDSTTPSESDSSESFTIGPGDYFTNTHTDRTWYARIAPYYEAGAKVVSGVLILEEE